MKSLPYQAVGSVGLQILAYLSTHPDARDTVEGIAEWWLLEQRIRKVIREIKSALAELVAQRMILSRRGRDGRIHYRLNPRKRAAVDRLLQELSAESGAIPPETVGGEATGER